MEFECGFTTMLLVVTGIDIGCGCCEQPSHYRQQRGCGRGAYHVGHAILRPSRGKHPHAMTLFAA